LSVAAPDSRPEFLSKLLSRLADIFLLLGSLKLVVEEHDRQMALLGDFNRISLDKLHDRLEESNLQFLLFLRLHRVPNREGL
jgi:hypothetical protein